MTSNDKDRLAALAVGALLVISLVAITGGLWAAMVNGREIEGIVAIVAGAVGGIVAIVTRARNGA